MGIPIRDDNRHRESFPLLTIALIAANVAIFFWQMSHGQRGFETLVQQYGVVPAEILRGQDLPPLIDYPVYLTVFSSMFMHANLMHLGGNMLYMWVFADNLEDVMGKGRFILFYLLCGVLAALAQVVVSAVSGNPAALRIPAIGASGAIAGVMGGYLRLFPGSRVDTLIGWWGIFPLPAAAVLGLWIVTQILSGVGSFGGEALGGVAYAAHVGGFVAGLVLVGLFARPRGGRGRDRWG